MTAEYTAAMIPGNAHALAWSKTLPRFIATEERLTPLGTVEAVTLERLDPVPVLEVLVPLGTVLEAELWDVSGCNSLVTEIYPLVLSCQTVVSLPYDQDSSSS